MDCDLGKRAALRRVTACLVAAAASGMSVAHGTDKDLLCVDPSVLSEAQKQQRKADNYTEKSPDPSKTCSGCNFFTPEAKGAGCGSCAIFNGPANPKGKCDDWAPRAA